MQLMPIAYCPLSMMIENKRLAEKGGKGALKKVNHSQPFYWSYDLKFISKMCPQCFCCSVPTLRFKVIVVTASCCLDFLVQLDFKMYLYAIQFLQSAPLSDSDFIV